MSGRASMLIARPAKRDTATFFKVDARFDLVVDEVVVGGLLYRIRTETAEISLRNGEYRAGPRPSAPGRDAVGEGYPARQRTGEPGTQSHPSDRRRRQGPCAGGGKARKRMDRSGWAKVRNAAPLGIFAPFRSLPGNGRRAGGVGGTDKRSLDVADLRLPPRGRRAPPGLSHRASHRYDVRRARPFKSLTLRGRVRTRPHVQLSLDLASKTDAWFRCGDGAA